MIEFSIVPNPNVNFFVLYSLGSSRWFVVNQNRPIFIWFDLFKVCEIKNSQWHLKWTTFSKILPLLFSILKYRYFSVFTFVPVWHLVY